MKNRLNPLLVSIICFSLSACGGSDNFHDLKAHIDQLKTAAGHDQAKNTLQLPSPPIATTYNASNRTPFSMTAQPVSKKMVGSDPLQAASLSALRFVGTIHQDGVIIAFILTPDNKIYHVKEGDLIGDHYGKITHISHDKIDIMEQSANGSHQQRLVTLQLKEGNP